MWQRSWTYGGTSNTAANRIFGSQEALFPDGWRSAHRQPNNPTTNHPTIPPSNQATKQPSNQATKHQTNQSSTPQPTNPKPANQPTATNKKNMATHPHTPETEHTHDTSHAYLSPPSWQQCARTRVFLQPGLKLRTPERRGQRMQGKGLQHGRQRRSAGIRERDTKRPSARSPGQYGENMRAHRVLQCPSQSCVRADLVFWLFLRLALQLSLFSFSFPSVLFLRSLLSFLCSFSCVFLYLSVLFLSGVVVSFLVESSCRGNILWKRDETEIREKDQKKDRAERESERDNTASRMCPQSLGSLRSFVQVDTSTECAGVFP